MDDLISRKWLVECLEEGWIKLDTEKDYNRMMHLVRDTAPSVQPERKKGEWIDLKCNQCGQVDMSKPNFCPNCGADMRSEQE